MRSAYQVEYNFSTIKIGVLDLTKERQEVIYE